MNADELDDLIDRGIRAYVAREPAFGMEVRVLRRVQRRDSRVRFAWAVAACVLGGIFAARMWRKPVETLDIRPVLARIEVPPLIFSMATGVRVVRHGTSITAGERALLRFVQDHPEQALEAFAKADDSITVDSIDIPRLAIEPLETIGPLETQEEKQK